MQLPFPERTGIKKRIPIDEVRGMDLNHIPTEYWPSEILASTYFSSVDFVNDLLLEHDGSTYSMILFASDREDDYVALVSWKDGAVIHHKETADLYVKRSEFERSPGEFDEFKNGLVAEARKEGYHVEGDCLYKRLEADHKSSAWGGDLFTQLREEHQHIRDRYERMRQE